MQFIETAEEFINLEKVAKVKKGSRGLTVVYTDDQVLASRVTGKDARTLEEQLRGLCHNSAPSEANGRIPMNMEVKGGVF